MSVHFFILRSRKWSPSRSLIRLFWGEAVESKEFRLDINVILNDRTLINLEMQIANRLNWKERSVMYLCRSFDSLNRGQDYTEAKPAIHIGFLDYTLFEDQPEFYASYKLINVKNYQKYSDSITLNVVDLSHIELATEEDRKYHIHEWAALFKAETWEEIKVLASKDEYLNQASQTMFRMSADEQIRKRCLDREEYYQDLRNYERTIEKYERDREEHEQDLRNYERAIEKYERDREEHEQDLRNYERAIEKYERDREEHEQDLRNYERAIEKYERDREEHEQDLRNYEQTIEKYERDREEHEQDLRNYERTIEKYERDKEERERALAEREARIQHLLAENQMLKEQAGHTT